MITVKEVISKIEWEDFLGKQLNTLFVQSFHYGEFYEKMGEQSWLVGIYDDDQLIGGTLIVSTHAKRGNFLYLPYGPIGTRGFDELFIYLKNFAKKNKYDFIRVSPFLIENDENKKLFSGFGFKDAPMHMLAETTWLLDLNQDETQLLKAMNKNHRNLIHRCEKEGVKIETKNNIEGLKDFNKLHDATARRHNFHRFSADYISKEFSSFASTNQSLIFNAYLSDGQLDSSAIIMFYGNMASYRHGASLNLNNKVPTSYLLQWEAIREAKRRGMKWYNFWGIAPEGSSKKHPFYGITHFKKGFGGHQVDLLHCQDLPITAKYWFNWLIETVRRIKRGF